MAQDELYDEWANEGSGGAPVVSWLGIDPGDDLDTFTAIIVPPRPIDEPGKGYEIVKDYDKKELRVWPPQDGYTPKPGVNPKAPILLSEFKTIAAQVARDRNLEPEEERPVTLTSLTLLSAYSNKEYFSKPKVRAAKEDPEFVDNGIRRFIVDGADIPTKFKDAVRKVGTRGPQIGQRLTVKLTGRVPNVGKDGERRVHEVTIEPATVETLSLVQKYITEAKSAAASAGTDDPWAQGQDPEPAF